VGSVVCGGVLEDAEECEIAGPGMGKLVRDGVLD
jgi:hypothetical protein